MSKKVVIYVNKNSLCTYLNERIQYCLHYAKKKNFIVQKIYTDESNDPMPSNRSGYTQLLKECSSSEIDAVIIPDFSKLSSNRIEVAICSYQLKNMGIDLISLNELPETLLVLTLMEDTIKYYSETFLKNTDTHSKEVK